MAELNGSLADLSTSGQQLIRARRSPERPALFYLASGRRRRLFLRALLAIRAESGRASRVSLALCVGRHFGRSWQP